MPGHGLRVYTAVQSLTQLVAPAVLFPTPRQIEHLFILQVTVEIENLCVWVCLILWRVCTVETLNFVPELEICSSK